jgi:hypothetical protein
MNKLDRLESLAEQLIEGFFARLGNPRHNGAAARPARRRPTDTKEIAIAGPAAAARWQVILPGRHVQLGGPVVTLGRALDNDIILDDPLVSRYHAQLRWRNHRYFLYWVNSPDAPRPLNPGDWFTLGQTPLTVLVERNP